MILAMKLLEWKLCTVTRGKENGMANFQHARVIVVVVVVV